MHLVIKFIAMKKIKSKIFFTACLITGCLLVASDAHSQDRRLPDGTIVYSDGTRRLPNGTIIYKGGNNGDANNYPNNGGVITLPDGSVIYPDGSRRDRNDDRRYDRRNRNRNNNREWMPPGQAKKVYGGSARDYAPGQQKKWKGRDDDDYGKGKGKGKGKGRKH